MAKKQPISIGGINFDTKGKAEKYIQEILHKYPLNTSFSKEDFFFMENLLEYHPRYEDKVGNGITSIMIRLNEYGTNRQFYIVRTDGSLTEFSYPKCLQQKERSNLLLFRESARHAIKDQVITYKIKYFEQNQNEYGKVVCEETNELISTKECHVDHHPKSFISIVTDFIQSERIDVDKIKYTGFGDNEQEKEFEDSSLANRFRKYHRENAKYRIITIKVNLTKKKK